MMTCLHFDSTHDYLTNDKGVIEAMDTIDSEAAQRALLLVQMYPVDGIPLGDLLDEELTTKQGKDGGWHTQVEADGSVTVERRFTEKRGMTYAPLTYAFKVRMGGYAPVDHAEVVGANRAATRFVPAPLDE